MRRKHLGCPGPPAPPPPGGLDRACAGTVRTHDGLESWWPGSRGPVPLLFLTPEMWEQTGLSQARQPCPSCCPGDFWSEGLLLGELTGKVVHLLLAGRQRGGKSHLGLTVVPMGRKGKPRASAWWAGV